MNKFLNQPPLLDAIGLFSAGLINTFLAPIAAVIVFGPGTEAAQPDLILRITWISENTLRWKGGWLFWFAVTLSFAWSYFALGRHLNNKRPWIYLSIGLALIAAAVDLVGVVVNLTLIPELAQTLATQSPEINFAMLAMFESLENFAYALINITAFGLYSFAGLLLVPALFATKDYARWLAWLGTTEWVIALFATALLIVAPNLATVPLLISFALFAPWVWGSAIWLLRRQPHSTRAGA